MAAFWHQQKKNGENRTFNITYGNGLEFYKMKPSNNGIPFVSRTFKNNRERYSDKKRTLVLFVFHQYNERVRKFIDNAIFNFLLKY